MNFVYAHLIQPHNQDAARRLENTVLATTDSKMAAETKNEVSSSGLSI